jgi:hypothetical protein
MSLVDVGPSFGGSTVHDVNVRDGFLLRTPLRRQSACWRKVDKFCPPRQRI